MGRRRNRRAFTRGIVRDNAITSILRMEDGFPWGGTIAWHYRRRFVDHTYTGIARINGGSR